MTAQDASPVEVYARIARGAMACWFGPQGNLKKTHIFHADVASPAEGTGATIDLHERDMAAASPRSLKAFKIVIAPQGTGSSVVAENLRLPVEVGASMLAEVGRWAAGGEGCSAIGSNRGIAGQVTETSSIAPATPAAVALKGKKSGPN